MFFKKKNKKAQVSKQEALLKELLEKQSQVIPSSISDKDIKKLENDLAKLKARM